MAGNLHLPRLGDRGVTAPPPGTRVKREPKRYAVAERKAELAGPAVETLRGPVTCEAIDFDDYTVAVRAVLDAKPATCRMPFGQLEHLTFCGAKATVKAGGALTYCAACASRRWFDLEGWKRMQDSLKVAQERLNVARSPLQGDGIEIDLSDTEEPAGQEP